MIQSKSTGTNCMKMPVCRTGRYREGNTDYSTMTEEEYFNFLFDYSNTKVCPRWSMPSYTQDACPKRKMAFPQKLRQAGIPDRYFGFNRETVEQEPRKAWVTVNRYLDTLEDRISKGEGLLLHGPFGTGKTTGAVVVAQEAIDRGYSVRFLGVDYLISELRGLSAEQAAAYRKELLDKDLLVLDGLEDDADGRWLLDEIGAIIARRYDNKKPMIITTNSDPSQLKKGALPQRYVERILHACHPVPVVGKNWRQ
jgi:DNA replication protein DnaC